MKAQNAPFHLEALSILPQATTVTEILSSVATVDPARLALTLVTMDATIGQQEEPMSFGQLWTESRRAAGWMRAQGVKPGDRVLLVYPTGREFIHGFFGALLAGAVPVPYTPPFGLAKIENYLPGFEAVVADSGAKLCVTVPNLALLLRGAARGITITSLGYAAEPLERLAEVKPSDLAFLQYTSGSTSAPKGVMLTHANLIANIDAFCHAIAPRAGDQVVSWLPLFHDMGLIGMLLGSLYSRVPLFLMSPELFIRNPEIWLRTISRHQATLTCAPNFAFHYCVKRIDASRVAGLNLSSVRAMLNGAEPVDVSAVEGFEAHFAASGFRRGVILPVYGLAESSLAVTFPRLGELLTETVDLDRLEIEGVAATPTEHARSKVFVSVGKALRTQEVSIFDDAGRTLRDRQIGEIVVRGPSVMQGYYNKSKETERTLAGGWLRTGDYGYLSEGNLYITGRKKDLIIRRGRNYFPQDIEAVVGTVAGVRKGRAVAFGIEKDGSESEVVIVAEARVKKLEEEEKLKVQIQFAVSKHFPFSPIDVQVVPPGTVPRTSSGKVRRQPCKEMYVRGTLLSQPKQKSGPSTRLVLRAVVGNLAHALKQTLRTAATAVLN